MVRAPEESAVRRVGLRGLQFCRQRRVEAPKARGVTNGGRARGASQELPLCPHGVQAASTAHMPCYDMALWHTVVVPCAVSFGRVKERPCFSAR